MRADGAPGTEYWVLFCLKSILTIFALVNTIYDVQLYKIQFMTKVGYFFIWIEVDMIKSYMTVSEAAEKWDINKRTVQIMCADEKIESVARFGKSWAIPSDAERPDDKRVKTGLYKDWRKKKQG